MTEETTDTLHFAAKCCKAADLLELGSVLSDLGSVDWNAAADHNTECRRAQGFRALESLTNEVMESLEAARGRVTITRAEVEAFISARATAARR